MRGVEQGRMPKTVALLVPVLAAAALPFALTLVASGTSATNGMSPITCAQPNPKLPGVCVGEIYVDFYYGTIVAGACTPGTKPGPTDVVCNLRP